MNNSVPILGVVLEQQPKLNQVFLNWVDNLATGSISLIKQYLPNDTNTYELLYDMITNSLMSLQSYAYAYEIPYLLQIWSYKSYELQTKLAVELIKKYLPNRVVLNFLPKTLTRTSQSLNNATQGETSLDTTANQTNLSSFFPNNTLTPNQTDLNSPVSNTQWPLSEANVSTMNNTDISSDNYENLRYYLETLKDTQFEINKLIYDTFKPYFSKFATIDVVGVLW